jgi:hypothetical protein
MSTLSFFAAATNGLLVCAMYISKRESAHNRLLFCWLVAGGAGIGISRLADGTIEPGTDFSGSLQPINKRNSNSSAAKNCLCISFLLISLYENSIFLYTAI